MCINTKRMTRTLSFLEPIRAAFGALTMAVIHSLGWLRRNPVVGSLYSWLNTGPSTTWSSARPCAAVLKIIPQNAVHDPRPTCRRRSARGGEPVTSKLSKSETKRFPSSFDIGAQNKREPQPWIIQSIKNENRVNSSIKVCFFLSKHALYVGGWVSSTLLRFKWTTWETSHCL